MDAFALTDPEPCALCCDPVEGFAHPLRDGNEFGPIVGWLCNGCHADTETVESLSLRDRDY